MQTVLQRARDPQSIRNEISAMRAQMAQHKTPAGPLDVKRLRGGLIDCEFLVHFLQLRGEAGDGALLGDAHPAAYSPDLGTAIPALIAAGLLPRSFRPDYDLLTRMIVALRLLGPMGAEPPECAARALAKACRAEDYATLTRDFAQARGRVCDLWNQTFSANISSA